MALNVIMNQKGLNAKNTTAKDLTKAIEEMEAAASELGKCTGLGAEIYLIRLNSLKEKFTKVRDRFNR